MMITPVARLRNAMILHIYDEIPWRQVRTAFFLVWRNQRKQAVAIGASGRSKICHHFVENPVAFDGRREHSFHVFHYKRGGFKLFKDIDVFLIQKISVILVR